METIYLDNAATTPMRPEVIAEMTASMQLNFGNPSSTHAQGRQARSAVEMARKSIAKILNCTSQEIIFTSGATEANNWILQNAVQHLGIKRIITTKIEHHAVLHPVEALRDHAQIAVNFVKVKPTGDVDITHLTELLSDSTPTLVSLMHVNNEVGTVLDIALVSRICKQHGALFHSDTVQSVGKTPIDLKAIDIDFIVASAHKFHGPKGIGFLYVRKGLAVRPITYGGEQEKGLRPGTESVHDIVGMAKALELSIGNLDHERTHIAGLRDYTISQLRQYFGGVKINGNEATGFYNLINVCLPIADEKAAMMLFHLDIKGIAISRGSACQSGSARPSHVLAQMLDESDIRKPSLRISFNHLNTRNEIDVLIDALRQL